MSSQPSGLVVVVEAVVVEAVVGSVGSAVGSERSVFLSFLSSNVHLKKLKQV